VDFDAFSRRAAEILREIPPEFLRGVVGVEAHRRTEPHPQLSDLPTLGVCATHELPWMADPTAMRSRVHLYHGSFVSLARDDPLFDWESELRETILHEVRHHIEDRAGIGDLRDEDALEEALARFASGHELPEGWYRHGEAMEEDVWRVGDDLFVEVRLRRRDLDGLRGEVARMTVLGEPLTAVIPDDVEPAELLTIEGEGLAREHGRAGDLHLVIRERS
jgi:hypothetical protein